MTVIVIPDAHAQPGVSNERFSVLGRMICSIMSESKDECVVVNIGDMVDLPSLNTFDRPGSKAYEGKRYRLDIEAGLDAQRLLFDEVDNYNRPRRGEAKLDIKWHYTLGNHEARISRAIESDPAKLEGAMSLDDLTNNGEFPWRVYPFLEPMFLNEVGFCHYWSSGVMGRAIGGENPAASILKKQMFSCVQGHTHTMDFAERSRADGKKLSAAVVGCYFTHFEEWAGPQVNQLWRPGVAVLRDVHDGQFDFEWWSYRRVLAEFG